MAPFVAWAITSGSDEAVKNPDGLILERFADPSTGKPEIVVYLPERDLNEADAVPGGTVRLQCFDEADGSVFTTQEDWPLTTDLGGALPHAHRPVAPDVLDKIRRCTLASGSFRMSGSEFR